MVNTPLSPQALAVTHVFTGGAYVPTLLVGMYAPLGWLFLADSANMPKGGTSVLPVSEGSPLGLQAAVVIQNLGERGWPATAFSPAGAGRARGYWY